MVSAKGKALIIIGIIAGLLLWPYLARAHDDSDCHYCIDWSTFNQSILCGENPIQKALTAPSIVAGTV